MDRQIAMALILPVSFLQGTLAMGQEVNTEALKVATNARVAQTQHRSVEIDGLTSFHCESGPWEAPTALLLRSFPTSSQMFHNLIAALGDRYHVVSPDDPGYGNTTAPAADEFEYGFDNVSQIIDKFTESVGLMSHSPYLQD